MKKMFRTCLMLSYSALIALSARADVIKKTMGEEKGTFTAYKQSKFFFKTENGKTIEIPKATTRQLILDEPVKITFLRKGKSSRESGELLGYDKLQFKLKQKNKTLSLSAMYITSMDAQIASSGGGMGGGGAVGSGDTAIPAIDTSEFDESVMTEAQKSALDTYRTVRRKYNSFLSESSALVAKMDRSTGAQREALLSKLRIRKNQEQPVRLEMSGAHKGLLAAFPKGFPLKPKEAPRPIEPAGPAPGESAAEVIEDTVSEEDGEVLLIDTTPLQKSGNLSDEQMQALDAYEKAAVAFEKLSAKHVSLANAIQAAPPADKANLMPMFEQGEKDVRAARNKLLKTQKAFLKAFPQLILTD